MGKPNRIREWREAKGLTLEDLAELSAISLSYLSRMETGDRNVSLKFLAKISLALHVPERDLVGSAGNVVKLAGRIGAGSRINRDVEQIEQSDISLDFPVSPELLAFEVTGDSMWPKCEDGDIILCAEISRSDVSLVIGRLAAVQTVDGSRYFKRLERGSQDELYNLESVNPTSPPIRDEKLEWIASIRSIIPRGQWRYIDNETRNKLTKSTRGATASEKAAVIRRGRAAVKKHLAKK